MSRSEFIAACLHESQTAQDGFKELWQRVGLSVDWKLCYSTISAQVRKISQESFIRLYNKGYVYRKNEPALYCAACRTSVAQAELEDVEKKTFFNDIVFTDAQGNDLIIATTRPELLYSVNAVFYHPDDQRYQHLKGTFATVAIFGHQVPIMPDEAVNPEKGTGLVMCSTFGDKMDVAWTKKYNLPYRPSLGLHGKWLPQTGILAGMNALQARERILLELANQKKLLRQIEITHSVNTHERCKKEIEYLMLWQWFLKILDYKKELLQLADDIRWYPSYMKQRYVNWVENISWDWCLSRQRHYGIPFPAWHCTSCNTIILAKIEQLPIDPQETKIQGPCPKCKSSEIVADTDVMDTWNTSSLTPYICASLAHPERPSVFEVTPGAAGLPMSMRPQAHDIIRTWAFYTIIKTWMHHDTIPWNDIVISGHVLSGQSEKISKSRANESQTPTALLTQHPADAIRIWTASGNLGQDIAFSDAQIKIGQRLITKLWNAFLFIKDHTAEMHIQDPEELGIVNEWLLHQTSTCFIKYQQAFEEYEFGVALNAIGNFFWTDFCDNYLEIIKDQLFKSEKYSQAQVYATRWTLYKIGLRILQMYAPFVPHVTEAIYQQIYKQHMQVSSLHISRFDYVQTLYIYQESWNIMQYILTIIAQVRKLKTYAQLSLKVPLAQLTITSSPDLQEELLKHANIITGVTQAANMNFTQDDVDTPALKETQPGQWHALVMAVEQKNEQAT